MILFEFDGDAGVFRRFPIDLHIGQHSAGVVVVALELDTLLIGRSSVVHKIQVNLQAQFGCELIGDMICIHRLVVTLIIGRNPAAETDGVIYGDFIGIQKCGHQQAGCEGIVNYVSRKRYR